MSNYPSKIDKYSVPLEQKMLAIGRLEPDIMAALQTASRICQDRLFVDEASTAFKSVAGRSGDGALEVYRDLGDNIRTMTEFVNRHRTKKDSLGYCEVMGQAQRLLDSLQSLSQLIDETPPEIMKAIKNMIKHGRYVTSSDEEKYEFKGNSLVMIATFAAVILLRYFQVISWSWYIVVPVAIAAMVIVPALLSTLRFTKRGYLGLIKMLFTLTEIPMCHISASEATFGGTVLAAS